MNSRTPVFLSLTLLASFFAHGCLPPARRQPPGPTNPQNSNTKTAPNASPLSTQAQEEDRANRHTDEQPGPDPVSPSSTAKKVISVQDGDTITVIGADNSAIRIRLAGIDAPERGRPFSDRAKSNLSELVLGKVVTLECKKADRYNRPVCKVILNDEDIGLRQIADGMAWHFKRYENEQSPEDRVRYTEAETKARSERVGLWASTISLEPQN